MQIVTEVLSAAPESEELLVRRAESDTHRTGVFDLIDSGSCSLPSEILKACVFILFCNLRISSCPSRECASGLKKQK